MNEFLNFYESLVYTDFWSPADCEHTNLHFLNVIKKISTLAFQINFKIFIWIVIGHT